MPTKDMDDDRTRQLLDALHKADRAVFADLAESMEPRDFALLTRKPSGHSHNCGCWDCE